MTLERIAKAAGVSIATVSRVVNASNGVSDSTVELVKETMRSLEYRPPRRKNMARGLNASSLAGRRIAFYVLAAHRGRAPSHDLLLRGVSNAARKLQLDLHVGFVDESDQALDEIAQRRPDGLLLHGYCPPAEVTRPFHDIPAVWLMGNSSPATWGDQVMPDNVVVGRIAAEHLVGRGHRRVVYYGYNSAWSMAIRAMAFELAVRDLGATPTIINPLIPESGYGHGELGLQHLIRACQSANPPTGLFVAEDWLLRDLYNALPAAGIRIGQDLDIISCNYDRPHLMGLSPMPASIDIRFEQIAQRGVERLAARMQQEEPDDRLRIMVEPKLVADPLAPSVSQAGALVTA